MQRRKKYDVISGTGATYIGIPNTITTNITEFKNGEIQIQLKESVRHSHVIIIQSFNKPNKHLVELLLLIDAARRACAASITVIIPSFPYARQDRKSDAGTPISARVVCDMLKAVNVDRVLTLDLHATQIQGFMDSSIQFDHISSSAFLAYHLKKHIRLFNEYSVCSPDAGGVKRAKKLRDLLHIHNFCMIDKTREKPGEVNNMEVIGDVLGKKVLIVDDMIDSAGTLAKAIDVLYYKGAVDVSAVATHGIFSTGAYERLESIPVYITNTLCINNAPSNIITFDIKPLINYLINKIETGDTIGSLFYKWEGDTAK